MKPHSLQSAASSIRHTKLVRENENMHFSVSSLIRETLLIRPRITNYTYILPKYFSKIMIGVHVFVAERVKTDNTSRYINFKQ